MKRIILFTILFLSVLGTNAQIKKAKLQASGLTCSMCNLSILKSLQKLPFVEKVESNVETATYEIEFKPTAEFSMLDVQRAVVDAGFSVAMLTFEVQPQKIAKYSTSQFTFSNVTYHIVDGGFDLATDVLNFQVIDKGFLPEKKYKKYKGKIVASNGLNIIKI